MIEDGDDEYSYRSYSIIKTMAISLIDKSKDNKTQSKSLSTLKSKASIDGQAIIFKFRNRYYTAIRTLRRSGFITYIYNSNKVGEILPGNELYHRRDILVRQAIKEFVDNFVEKQITGNPRKNSLTLNSREIMP